MGLRTKILVAATIGVVGLEVLLAACGGKEAAAPPPYAPNMVMKLEEVLKEKGYRNTTGDWEGQNRPIYVRMDFWRPHTMVIIDRYVDSDGAFFVWYRRGGDEYDGRFNAVTGNPVDNDAPKIKKILGF